MTQHPFCLSCISGCFQHGDTSKELVFYVATWRCTCQPAFRNGRCGGINETKVSAWNGQLVVCVYRLPGLSHPAKATSKPRWWCRFSQGNRAPGFFQWFLYGPKTQLSTMLDPLWHLKESSWYWFDWALSVIHAWIAEMVMVAHSCHNHSLQKKTSSCWVLGVLVAFPQPHKTNRDLDTADIFNWKGHAFSWPLMATDGHWSRHLCTIFACGLDILGILKEKEEPKSQSDHVTLSIFPIHGQELATKSPRNTMVFMAGNNGLTRPCPFSTPKHFGGKRKTFHESCRKDVLKRTLSRRSHQGLHPMSHVVFFFSVLYVLFLTYTDTSDLQTAHLRVQRRGACQGSLRP